MTYNIISNNKTGALASTVENELLKELLRKGKVVLKESHLPKLAGTQIPRHMEKHLRTYTNKLHKIKGSNNAGISTLDVMASRKSFFPN